MEPLRKELAEGVFLTYVPAAKFKTGVLGAQLITPLEESTVAAGALLPAVLRRGTTAHRDMRSIAAELRPPLRGVHRLHRAQEGRESMPRLCRQLS